MARRKDRQKAKILKELEEYPLITRACNKVGVPRATLYRWCAQDRVFAADVELSQSVGRQKLSDFAESKLVENIQAGMHQAIVFWLTHNREAYRPMKLNEMEMLRITAEAMASNMSKLLEMINGDLAEIITQHIKESRLSLYDMRSMQKQTEDILRRLT